MAENTVQSFAEQVLKVLHPTDEFVNRKYLGEHVFHCTDKTVGKLIHQPGFPVINVEGMEKRYSLKAVNKFMTDHQIYIH